MKTFRRLISRLGSVSVLDILSVSYTQEYKWKQFVWKRHEVQMHNQQVALEVELKIQYLCQVSQRRRTKTLSLQYLPHSFVGAGSEVVYLKSQEPSLAATSRTDKSACIFKKYCCKHPLCLSPCHCGLRILAFPSITQPLPHFFSLTSSSSSREPLLQPDGHLSMALNTWWHC